MKKAAKSSLRSAKAFAALRALFIACAPIILISLCVAVLLAANSLRRISEESRRVLEQNFSNAVSQVEWELSSANTINYKLSVNRDLTSYLTANTRDFYKEYSFRSMLNSVTGSGLYSCSETMLYMDAYDYILTAEWGAERTTHFPADQAQSLLKQIAGQSDYRLSALRVFSAGEEDISPLILFVRSVSSGKNTTSIITTIDSSELKRKVREILWRDTDHLILYNDQGVLLSTMDEETSRSIYREIRAQNGEYAGDGQAYELSYANSPGLRGLKYAFVSTPLSAVALVRNTSLSTIAFVLVVMLLLIAYVFYLNYRPLQKTMKNLEIVPADGVNDLAAIENTVQRYIARNDELNRQVASSENRLRRLFLEKLLEGRIAHMENIGEALSLYNIVTPHPYLMVALFQPSENVSFLSNNEAGGRTLEEILLKSLRQHQIDLTVYSLEINDGWVFVFNGREEELADLRENALTQTCRAAQDWLGSEYTCTASRLYDGPEKLPLAYREVLEGAVQEEPARLAEESGGVGEISARCQQLIHQRYADIDFSVAMIAEEMKLSPSYLSRMFKQQVGMGLLEYIHRYRIMRARQIMDEEPQLPLEEAASRTGFYNVAALIRVFKKIEGVTPGQYRSGAKNDQNLNVKN